MKSIRKIYLEKVYGNSLFALNIETGSIVKIKIAIDEEYTFFLLF